MARLRRRAGHHHSPNHIEPVRDDALPAPALLCALFVGTVVRLSYVLRQDFTLNDGGMFYLMTKELQRARYALPAFTAYNEAGIPFAYPPLGLYLAGLVADLGPWSLLEVFRFLPLVTNVLAIVAFCHLGGCLLQSRAARVFALFAFVLLPGSFTWLIMGGGITRSWGFLFAILTIRQAYLLYTQPAKKHLLATVTFAAATVLSHLAIAWSAALVCALLFLAYGRNRDGIVNSLSVALGTLAMTAPWWATVVLRHGLAPFLSASHSPEPVATGVLRLLLLIVTDEAYFPLLSALAFLGVLASLADRRYLLPDWLATVVILDPRTLYTTATLPLALLAGTGIAHFLLPGLARRPHTSTKGTDDQARELARNRLVQGALVFVYIYALYSALTSVAPLMQGLALEERQAMRWVAEHTPRDSTFLVVTGDGMWGGDRTSEWFPVLAERTSVATVQGYEWFEGFEQRTHRYAALQECAAQGLDCLGAWATETGVTFSHVYVGQRRAISGLNPGGECCANLRSALGRGSEYRVVYDGPGATIYRKEGVAGYGAAGATPDGRDQQGRETSGGACRG